MFAGLFAVGVILLLGLVYWKTFQFMSERANGIITSEFRQVAEGPPEDVRALLAQMSTRDPLTRFGLFAPDGRRLAGRGDFGPSDLPLDGEPHDFRSRHGEAPQRAMAERLPSGEILVVQRDTLQLMQLRQVIVRALLWSGGAIVSAGLLLGVGLSLKPLRRVQAMQQASAAVAQGRLDMRLPVDNSHDELDQLAGIVNTTMDELERLLGEARTVGESVAHGLRAPLTRLRTSLDHAYDLDRDDARGQLIERCIEEVDVLLARFRALLRIAAVEGRDRRREIEPISLSKVVDQIGELYHPLAASREVGLYVRTAKDVQVRADAELLFEALSNLVDNALKFTPPGGEVFLILVRGDDEAVVEVRDNGPGIPAAERAFVTKRFYRGQAAADIAGHGLGLALVAAVADLHGFQLSIGGDTGTLVRLRCPLAA